MDKDVLTWLLIGWQPCCQPIRIQVWKFLCNKKKKMLTRQWVYQFLLQNKISWNYMSWLLLKCYLLNTACVVICRIAVSYQKWPPNSSTFISATFQHNTVVLWCIHRMRNIYFNLLILSWLKFPWIWKYVQKMKTEIMMSHSVIVKMVWSWIECNLHKFDFDLKCWIQQLSRILVPISQAVHDLFDEILWKFFSL